MKTPKAIETDIFVRVTVALSNCNKAQKQDYPAFVEALDRNRKLVYVNLDRFQSVAGVARVVRD